MRFLIFTTLSAMHWLIICWIGWSWILGETVEAHKMIALAFLSGAHSQVTVAMMRWYDYTHTAAPEPKKLAYSILYAWYSALQFQRLASTS